MKPEQASKVGMRMPTRPQNEEGRTDGEEIDGRTHSIRRGYRAQHAGKETRVTGETRSVGGRGFNVALGDGSGGSRTGAQSC